MSDSFATSWTVACQVPLWDFAGKNTGVSCYFPVQGNLPDPCIEPLSLALAGEFFITEPLGKGFPGGASDKEPACQCWRHKRCGFDPWVGKIPWRRKWQPTPVLLPGEFHGQRSLAGYIPRDRKGSDMTDWLSMSHLRSTPSFSPILMPIYT